MRLARPQANPPVTPEVRAEMLELLKRLRLPNADKGGNDGSRLHALARAQLRIGYFLPIVVQIYLGDSVDRTWVGDFDPITTRIP